MNPKEQKLRKLIREELKLQLNESVKAINSKNNAKILVETNDTYIAIRQHNTDDNVHNSVVVAKDQINDLIKYLKAF